MLETYLLRRVNDAMVIYNHETVYSKKCSEHKKTSNVDKNNDDNDSVNNKKEKRKKQNKKKYKKTKKRKEKKKLSII